MHKTYQFHTLIRCSTSHHLDSFDFRLMNVPLVGKSPRCIWIFLCHWICKSYFYLIYHQYSNAVHRGLHCNILQWNRWLCNSMPMILSRPISCIISNIEPCSEPGLEWEMQQVQSAGAFEIATCIFQTMIHNFKCNGKSSNENKTRMTNKIMSFIKQEHAETTCKVMFQCFYPCMIMTEISKWLILAWRTYYNRQWPTDNAALI